LLIDKMGPTGASIVPCVITAGYSTRQGEDGKYYIAKSALVSALMAALNRGHLELTTRSKEFDQMISELEHFQMTVKHQTGNEIYGASTGATDDLVVSAALAVWGATVHGAPLRLW
jgi:hypothetical protein